MGEKVATGEEHETLIYIKKAKLYRFRDGKWKERGDGYCKFLRSKDNKIRFIQRQEKTLKVTANFLIAENPLCELKAMNGKDNAFLWGCVDASDGAPTTEKLGIRLKDAAEATEFKTAWEAAQLFNKKAKNGDSDLVFAA